MKEMIGQTVIIRDDLDCNEVYNENILSFVKGEKDKTSLESETLARHTWI